MATGALGSVSNRLRHENGDTHVGVCDDVFSDAGSTPAASTIRLTLRLVYREPQGSLMASHHQVEWCPERAKRVEGLNPNGLTSVDNGIVV